MRDARLELAFAAVVVAGVVERTREDLDGFFCNGAVAALGFEMDEMDGFLRSCSVEEVFRSCD